MNNICFHFQISQPFRLRTYRFFDINKNHNYYDDYQNQYLTRRLAERCYIPANRIILETIKKYPGKFKVSFSISGSSIMLFEKYCPEVIDSFRELAATGCIEITGNTFTHSLASLHNEKTFMEQVRLQEELLKNTFGVRPISFCNTEIIYSDEIGEWLGNAGYRVILTEGARHILGWKSPTYLYCNPYQTDVKLLLRSYQLCDDITLRFTDKSWDMYPLTAEKYHNFLNNCKRDNENPLINLFWDYETIGEHYAANTGIFEFFKHLVTRLLSDENYRFISPKDALSLDMNISTMHAPWAISYSGEEKDTNEWLGNELQKEAFAQLFKLQDLYEKSENQDAKLAWLRLQTADHFNFMSSKWFAHRAVKRNFDVYSSPYQAFINYMNVLNDVKLQLEEGIR